LTIGPQARLRGVGGWLPVTPSYQPEAQARRETGRADIGLSPSSLALRVSIAQPPARKGSRPSSSRRSFTFSLPHAPIPPLFCRAAAPVRHAHASTNMAPGTNMALGRLRKSVRAGRESPPTGHIIASQTLPTEPIFRTLGQAPEKKLTMTQGACYNLGSALNNQWASRPEAALARNQERSPGKGGFFL
jgi:hypothetical protein